MTGGRGLGLAALVLLTLALHAPSPDAGFTYDDHEFVVTNQSIRSLPGGLAALLRPFPPEQPERGLYRPLTNLSYAVDHGLWGDDATFFHATNVVVYAAVVVLVESLAFTYLGSAGFAFATALLFAVHPVHCDAVDSVAARSELLALLFGLASLLLFLRATPKGQVPYRGLLLASAAAYALACASKETGVVFPAVLLAHRLVLDPPRRGAGPRSWLRALHSLAPHAAVLAAYLVLRGLALGRFSPAGAILRESDLTARLSTIGTVFLVDLKLLVWPNLQVDFFYQAALGLPERFDAIAALGWAAIALAAGLSLVLVHRHFTAMPGEESRERVTALCALALFAATLFPTSHVLDIGALVAERFLFAPSLGFVLLLALAGRLALRRSPSPPLRTALAALALAAVALPWAARSQARAAVWRDPTRLWSEAARALPGDARVHTNLAGAHIERRELPEARRALESAFEIDPNYRAALGNLANLEMEEGRLDAAAAAYRRMLAQEPGDFVTWYNLGRIEMQRGDRAAAAAHFRRSLEINPNYSFARQGLEAASGSQGPR